MCETSHTKSTVQEKGAQSTQIVIYDQEKCQSILKSSTYRVLSVMLIPTSWWLFEVLQMHLLKENSEIQEKYQISVWLNHHFGVIPETEQRY